MRTALRQQRPSSGGIVLQGGKRLGLLYVVGKFCRSGEFGNLISGLRFEVDSSSISCA